MKFSIHHQLPVLPNQKQEERIRDTIEQIKAAEDLGFHAIWQAEGHFYPLHSIISAPLVYSSFVASQTSRIRIGTAAVSLPVHHPLSVLEEALTVDALSCGRLELGVGRGGVPFQFVGYGIPKDEIDDRYEESLSIIEHGWKNGFVQANGKHFKIPKVDIYPRPQQKSPPISVVVRSEPGIREAASQGWPAIISLMIHRMNGNLAEMADAYYKSFREVDKRKPHLSVVVPVFVGESSKGVRATIERSVYDIYRRNFGGIVNYAILEQTAAAWGNADTVLSNLKAVKDLTKAEEIVGWFNLGGLVGHRETLQSMQLFAHSVMGRLND